MAAAWVVFAAVAALLALFLIGITALILVRRARAGLERPPKDDAAEPLRDPWTEAGSRVHPYPLPDED
jgi:hypothetical protein